MASASSSRTKDLFQVWRAYVDPDVERELVELSCDAAALDDAFCRDLKFGTGGLRGIVGVGPNRMNIYTVAKATQGLANWLNTRFELPSVAIARDSRRMGEEFTHVVAEVLAANGIRALLYPRIEPTPALSFAVRDLGCSAGVCVTASHNPAEYNGYKVYGADGCQITTKAAAGIQAAINSVDVFNDVKRISFMEAEAAGIISWIGDETLDRYVKAVLEQSCDVDCSGLKVAYTPLHGAGLEPMERVLAGIGVFDLAVESAQAVPDGNFHTCPKPNPEEREALELGLALAQREGADLLLASDPDADRLGVAVRHTGGYRLLNGNEIGMLLLDFLCSDASSHEVELADKVAVTTVVSAPMADALAVDQGLELRRTLTGFKYIGEQVGQLEAEGCGDDFLFGFEESYGYLAGAYVRDKDAMVAAMLVCQAAARCKAAGSDLAKAMDALCERYGYWRTSLVSVAYPGTEGASHMASIMAGLRSDSLDMVAGRAVEGIVDYLPGVPMPVIGGRAEDAIQMLPPSDVFELRLDGGAKVIVRPSGTEPKIKAYVSVCGSDAASADAALAQLDAAVRELLLTSPRNA